MARSRRPQILTAQFRSGVLSADVPYVDNVILTRDLTRLGLDPDEVAQLTRVATWFALRRGAYIRPDQHEQSAELTTTTSTTASPHDTGN